MAQEALDKIGKQVDSADLAKLKTTATEGSDDDSFADLVSDIVSGDVDAEAVDERIVDLLNDLLDIPYVPDSLEAKVLGLAVDAVKAALVQIAQRVA